MHNTQWCMLCDAVQNLSRAKAHAWLPSITLGPSCEKCRVKRLLPSSLLLIAELLSLT
jgi:hypothetical protein